MNFKDLGLSEETIKAIDEFGTCKYHRPSFLRKHFEKQLTLQL